MVFHTIHIFAYGEAQIISNNLNYKTSVNNFKTLQDVIDEIISKKPAKLSLKNYHAIHITPKECDYVSLDKNGSFTIHISKIQASKISDLVLEFEELKNKAASI